jgi:RNA polymerase sigma-70 factor (ECF subfamily)
MTKCNLARTGQVPLFASLSKEEPRSVNPNNTAAALHRLDLPSEKGKGSPDVQSSDSSPELLLVDRVLSGDSQAFVAIVQRWQGPLINLAWRYCRDRSRAEEMTHEAFIRAWRGLGSWRRESSFSTWLFTVAANVYRSELKRIPVIGVSLEQVAEPSRPFVHDAELDGAARDEAVRRAVLALPEKYREPLILYYFHEMDLAAAAATMGMPEGTMKARLSRGRELLKRRFPQLRESLQGQTGHSPPLPQEETEIREIRKGGQQ